jgi:tRNA(Glu) U13 pseudouridine synthase TruD
MMYGKSGRWSYKLHERRMWEVASRWDLEHDLSAIKELEMILEQFYTMPAQSTVFNFILQYSITLCSTL